MGKHETTYLVVREGVLSDFFIKWIYYKHRESWTVKKAESRRTDAFELGVGEDS